MKETLGPDGKLNWQAGVETVVGPKRGDVGGRGARRNHHRDGVARHDAQQHEDDDGDADESDRRHGQAMGRAGHYATPKNGERAAGRASAPRTFTLSTPESAAGRRFRLALPSTRTYR